MSAVPPPKPEVLTRDWPTEHANNSEPPAATSNGNGRVTDVLGGGETTTPGAAVLDAVEAFLARFVAFPSDAARVAVTLWAAHCHAVSAFDSSPRLALLSPEPGSGKTRTLEVLDLLVPKPMHVLNASVAVTFRAVDAHGPTLLLDEVDAIFGRRSKDENEDLRGLLNAGHRRGAQIPRCVGANHDLKLFNVYAACALAGLGDLPDTLMSRSVIVRMRRRSAAEHVQPFRQRVHQQEGRSIGERLAHWIATVHDDLAGAWPAMPDGVTDRPADVWEPLLAVADAAGEAWPDRARKACLELLKVAASGEASLGVRLLADLRTVFGDADALTTEHVLDRLHKLDEAPWSDLRGRPLDARRLARLLNGYGVHSCKVKVDGRALQGYRREHLHDPWTRYLPQVPGQAEPPEPVELPLVRGLFEVPDEVPLTGQVPEPDPRTEPADPPLTREGSGGSTGSGQPGTCAACAEPLDPALTSNGTTMHVGCGGDHA